MIGHQLTANADRYTLYRTSMDFDGPIPLDTRIHWEWSDPLNLLLALLLVFVVLGVVLA
jgi:hypothetical protein